MNIVGPTRLVLLRAGKYDYGEVELINEGDDGHQCDAVRHHIPFRQRGKDD